MAACKVMVALSTVSSVETQKKNSLLQRGGTGVLPPSPSLISFDVVIFLGLPHRSALGETL